MNSSSKAPLIPPNSVAISAEIASPVLRPRSWSRKCIHFFLHSSALIKAQVTGIMVLLGSILMLLELVPETPFSDKYNPINQYLVKFSWFWTLMWLLVVMTTTSALYSGLVLSVCIRHLGRVVTSHFIWFSVTSLIEMLDNSVGECTSENILSQKACTKEGHHWSGFDISGHIFLLTYCVLVITEEAVNIKLELWREFEGTLSLEHRVVSKNPRLKPWLSYLYSLLGPFIEPLELCGLALILVWMFMILATSLYFHTFMEKVLGYLVAMSAWYVTYKVLYGRAKWLPCSITFGALNPLKHIRL